jgi:hypothetical protein
MTVFFGGPDPKTGEIKLGGTGFLVVHKENGYGFGYLVTARHVAKKVRPHGDVVIRVNKKGEDAVNFTVKDIYWAYHTDETVDVAVTPCSINQNEFDVAYYNLADLVRPSAAPYRVQCGDPICIVGLFHWHSGSGRNTPIVHSGNIALLPDPREKIPIKDRIAGQLQTVEALFGRSPDFRGIKRRAGFSARDGCDAGPFSRAQRRPPDSRDRRSVARRVCGSVGGRAIGHTCI